MVGLHTPVIFATAFPEKRFRKRVTCRRCSLRKRRKFVDTLPEDPLDDGVAGAPADHTRVSMLGPVTESAEPIILIGNSRSTGKPPTE